MNLLKDAGLNVNSLMALRFITKFGLRKLLELEEAGCFKVRKKTIFGWK